MKGKDIAILNHSKRRCAYDEVEIIKRLGWDHSELIENQLKFYNLNNFPTNFGLYELTAYIKRNNDITKTMGLMWWELICRFCSRDQISFPYVIWKLEKHLNISVLPGGVRDYNEFFKLIDKELKYDFSSRWG